MSDAQSPLDRYRRIAALRLEIQSAALKRAPKPLLSHWAKHLGLRDGKQIDAPDEFSATVLADLAVYVAWDRHDAGIFRYQDPPSEDAAAREALIAALRETRVALLRIIGPDPRGGVEVQEMGVIAPQWLMDEALARSTAQGATFVARIAQPDDFLITTGVVVHVDAPILDAVKAMPARMGQDGRPLEADFIANLYRAALKDARRR